ncbi:cotranscriptional regulator FAM172A homolog isoform X1 [Patella vulgata]|uniref:cotranscriptional regulator FAM172A homolog isoform X1 n=2 Tax=Patella vulgata TaxID=6465 RepID=UPI00217FC630|nr:cotranscriptional regulator FAM172A homolog isoform X1 [Patella vulgata]
MTGFIFSVFLQHVSYLNIVVAFMVLAAILLFTLLLQIMAGVNTNIPPSPAESEEEEPTYTFPETLQEFGYDFNDKGELRDIQTDEYYNFHHSEGDHRYNQKRYEALGEKITDYVYDLMEKETKLKRVYIPVDAEENAARSFIFMSEDALSNPDKLMVLIHGSGAVRAGQWSRKLIINDNLDKGTQLPYIREGIKQGYGIIVLNTNVNKVKLNDGNEHPVKKNQTPEEHGIYVWQHFVLKSKAKNIAIVAHSYGGIVTLEVANKFTSDILSRVFAIGFTDSVHSVSHQIDDIAIVDFLKEKAVNYVSSNKEQGEPVDSYEKHDCLRIAAGTNQHELTSWSCFNLLFDFIKDQYEKVKTAEESVRESADGSDNPTPNEKTDSIQEEERKSTETSSQTLKKEL